MNEHELKIYKKYRHYLTTQHGYGYPAERRQRARELTVNQFNIPYAEVKRIVAAGDALNGITHEKPKDHTPLGNLTFARVLIEQVQVGDRMVYATGTDARVIAIDGYSITFRGVHFGGSIVDTWTIQYEAGMTLAIVTNRARRVPATAPQHA